MKNEIKKNKKMVLALFIVAALAMVSVAAIALHSDDSSAAGSGKYIPMDGGNPLAIDGTITADYELYVDVNDPVGELGIMISPSASYTGTITVGTLDMSVSPMEYTPYSEMKFTNASNVDLSAQTEEFSGVITSTFCITNTGTDAQVSSDGAYELTKGVPSGTFELLQGSVSLGSDTVPFNGTVTAGGFSVTTEYTGGLILGISSDGKALISANDCWVPSLPDPDPKPTGWDNMPTPTLTFTGAASVQLPEDMQKKNDATGAPGDVTLWIDDNIEVTVADGSVITVGDRAPSLATSVVIDGTAIKEGVLFNTDGYTNPGTVNGARDAITFDNVPLGTFSLLIATDNGQYLGTATITPTGTSLGANSLPLENLPNDVFASTGKDNLTFDAGAYSFLSIVNLDKGEAGTATVDNGTSTGSITFAKNGFDDNEFLAIMRVKSTGVDGLFWGTVGSNKAVSGLLKPTSVTTALADPLLIRANAPEVFASIAIFGFDNDNVVHIFGTVNLLYVSKDQYGVFDLSNNAYVDLNADGGLVTQGVAPPATGSTGEIPVGSIFASDNLTAAYYFTNTTGTPATATYYFTSLENAIKNSNTVTLYGKIVILKDTTLNSPNSDPLTVIIGPNASLQVGRDVIDEDNPAISANLTIPEGTTLINPSDNDYSVVNGQAIYDVKPTPKSNEPTCDVLITGNNKYIYTDLATALDITTGNATIDTLQIVKKLMRSATVNTGVTLNDTFGITIPEKMTLTVNGTVNSTANMDIEGTLLVNNVVNFGAASNVNLNGSIVIAENGTLNLKGSKLVGGAESVIIIDGTLDMTNGAMGNVNTLYFEGTATITDLTVDGVLRIGAVPKLSTGYTNGAVLTAGKLTLGNDAVAWVYGTFDGKGAFTNTVISTVYMINATTYLTLYVNNGNTAQNLPFVYGDEFGADGYMLDIQINDWNNARNGRGDNLSENGPNSTTPAFVGNANWETVYADWSAKQYKVTFNYMQGVTWSCNGQTVVSSDNTVLIDYGASISVQAFVQPGFQGTPVIQKDGTAVSGNPYSMTITAPVTFSIKEGSVQVAGTGNTGSGSGSGGLTLIEILLIIIVIIIAIIAVIIAIRLLRS